MFYVFLSYMREWYLFKKRKSYSTICYNKFQIYFCGYVVVRYTKIKIGFNVNFNL